MSDENNSTKVAANSKYTSKSETESVFSVFDGFKKDADETLSSYLSQAKNTWQYTSQKVNCKC